MIMPRFGYVRSASWSAAIVSRLLQCLAGELKADPRSERLLYIKKGLEVRHATCSTLLLALNHTHHR